MQRVFDEFLLQVFGSAQVAGIGVENSTNMCETLETKLREYTATQKKPVLV